MKYVYYFDEGNREMKLTLGGKGANLAEMMKLGLPVPQGFTISTECCKKYYIDNKVIDISIKEEIFSNLKKLEEDTGKGFGWFNNPLLVSVRSGAAVSMPGMMDTVLNLGLNDETVEGLAKETNNYVFAYESYIRFIQMFSDVVLHIPKYKFDRIIDSRKSDKTEDYKYIIDKMKNLVKIESGKDFPNDPYEQLMMTIDAVFDSWNNTRAKIYRKINGISDSLGTAVNIQSMVFGNMGDNSGTGVAFTRNPSTGEKKLFGEFLMNAQGEDVVAGIRTPKDIEELREVMPDIYDEFINIVDILEKHYKDMQDIEFTIEKGKLYLLQTRNGKRTSIASVNTCVDMVNEGLISKEDAIMRIEPKFLDSILHPTFDENEIQKALVIAKGLPASPGASSGKIYFNSIDVCEAKNNNIKAILVRVETSPEDIEGMVNAEGILTSRGGMTSHAAVVARGMGKCCVSGCGEIRVDEENKLFKVGDKIYKEGDYISLDGNNGFIYEGEIKTKEIEFSGSFKTIMDWADEIRELGVRSNAETPRDALTSLKFGAEGIGLCRTEHMFFDENRINIVRQMIVARNTEERNEALNKLLPFQREDFYKIFEVMLDKPVTVRLLDPPLHEFLPNKEEEIKELSKLININYKELTEIIDSLKEFNPMLGHRGCRLAITYPEIYKMQVVAIINAAIDIKMNKNIDITPEIMVPLIGDSKELEIIKNIIIETIEKVILDRGTSIDYKIGTMIEVPRAALTADKIAKHAEFFSFGTNDLTQMTYAFSRDDSGKFISEYRDKNIFENDPFVTLDKEGVGRLIKLALELGKKERSDLKLGLCGEQGGDPESIDFCHKIGLDYVSTSPFRVPIARLCAAQAALRNR